MHDSNDEFGWWEHTNIVPARSTFHGRKRELALLEKLLEQGRNPVTVVGPPGVGKTRLARRFGEKIVEGRRDEFPGGAWFIDLSDTVTADDMVEETAKALAVPLLTDGNDEALPPRDKVGLALGKRGGLLLVFDGFEQLVSDGATLLEHWLKLAPTATFVVTSHGPLHFERESAVEVGPLSLSVAPGQSPTDLGPSEATALFIDRARLVRPVFAPGRSERQRCEEIVRRLDGQPLSIELAAARMDVLSASKVLEGLERVRVNPRQTSLSVALEWTWQLLKPHEKTALKQLAIFSGGISADAAKSVVELSEHDDELPDVLDVIDGLHDRSLVAVSETDKRDDLRFYLLHSIRVFAGDKLRQSPGAETVMFRHIAYFADRGAAWNEAALLRQAAPELESLRREKNNFNVALTRALSFGRMRLGAGYDVPTAVARSPGGQAPVGGDQILALLLALDPIATGYGQIDPYLANIDQSLEVSSTHPNLSPKRLARVLWSRGEALHRVGRAEDGLESLEWAVELAHSANDAVGHRLALKALTRLSRNQTGKKRTS